MKGFCWFFVNEKPENKHLRYSPRWPASNQNSWATTTWWTSFLQRCPAAYVITDH